MKIVKPLFVLSLLLGVSAGSYARTLSDGSATLEVLPARKFCLQLSDTLQSYAVAQGKGKKESVVMGAEVSRLLVRQLKAGKLNSYLDAASFVSSDVKNTSGTWLSIPDLLAIGLGQSPERVLLVEDVSDLRFTSHVMPGSQVILVASQAGDLSAERARLVAETAISLNVKIHLIWRGDAKDAQSARALAHITALTGGVAVDVNSAKSCPAG